MQVCRGIVPYFITWHAVVGYTQLGEGTKKENSR